MTQAGVILGRIVGVATPGEKTIGGIATTQQLRVVVNWFEELKVKVPVK